MYKETPQYAEAITNLILEKLYATSMRYIILYTSDVKVSKRFYNEVLGLPIQMKHGTYIEFNTCNTILSLNSRDDVREITGLIIQQPLWFHKHMKSALQWPMWKRQFKRFATKASQL